MKETTKNKIKYVNRQLLAIRLLERKAEDKKEQLEKWLESNADEISDYVQTLQAASIRECYQIDNYYIAKRMLQDGLPYHYIGKVANLSARQLYTIKVKINKGK